MNNITQSFDEWFDSEKEKGLVDIKLAIDSTSFSTREVQDEILKIETLLASGFVDTMPAQSSLIDPAAKIIIRDHLLKQ